MASQQKSHVPKFGNWDSSDNIPYTAYFEKARRDKSKGDDKVIMNPNDPEENPEAFMAVETTLNRNNNNNISSQLLPSLPHFNSTNSSNYKSKYSTNEQSSNYYNTQVENRIRRTKISNGSQKSINTSHDQSKANTSTERSSSGYSNSLQQQSRRSARSDSNNKSTTYASDDCSAALSLRGHIRHSSGSNSHSIDHQRAASIPKFGAWDETDPRSGENFTIIFNKVKEEKQNIASAQFPTPFNPPHVHNQRSRSSASKVCCCLFSNGGD